MKKMKFVVFVEFVPFVIKGLFMMLTVIRMGK